VPAWRAALAHLLVETGRLEEAGDHFDVLSSGGFRDFPFDNTWTGAMVLLGEVCAALGDERRAEMLYGMVAPFAARAVVLATVITCSGSLARTAGLLAATMADWSMADRHFEAALAANQSMGAAPFVILTLRDQAGMVEARNGPGDAERADDLRAQAQGLAASLGMDLRPRR